MLESAAVTESRSFDVLVVGSGASGLAAAVSAKRAGARVCLVTKGSLQSCNSAKAQGGIQAAFAADDSPEQHAEDVWRSSHEVADRTGHAITQALRQTVEASSVQTLPKAPLTELEAGANGWRARCGDHLI